MKSFIQIENNGYTIKISLQNIQYEDISYILDQIEGGSVNWWNFWTHDKLWYRDGSKCLNCQAVNHDKKVVIFG